MRDTRIQMGMPITVEIVDPAARPLIDDIYAWFAAVDARFSPYKLDSEISRLNRGCLRQEDLSADMREILRLAARTRRETDGYFEIQRPDGSLDPSGIVKGWAIQKAAGMVGRAGLTDFCIEAGGDIQSGGSNSRGEPWQVGIRSPFNDHDMIKIVTPRGHGVATSGSYVRGAHIYNPHAPNRQIDDIVSLTVIGPDILEADRFATAAFAMGRAGIHFIEAQDDLEAYLVDPRGIATQTRGFKALATA